MPSAIKSITPFYNNDSAAPPPFPTMLTDQLELFGKTSHSKSSGLLADEVLTPAHTLSSKKVRVSELPARSQKSTLAPEFTASAKMAARLGSPYPKRAPSQAGSASSTPSNSSEEEGTSSSDDESTSSTQSAEASKIPKPPGEPGRPGRGGYTLETALDWNQKAYSKFKKHIHALIDEHLDTTKCLSAQDPALLRVVRQKAIDKFPDLEDYSNCWPVNDMIMMRLKYTSSRARRQETEMTVSKKKKAKTPLAIGCGTAASGR
ncbi:hypothetical protein EDD16DRAFT_1719419 [Pisolithus croceorrhizus]|nr:hypothetical protein EDD16DRAFT_1720643 [Pisolithus croceorrhizus]KAI6168860.1 hypothetical protein EDD17DRAFT_1749214 [Pisolithus thermaeus]KAI6097120.1 hypothetical protein EDD16DRAFT_1719419 [Pisolithus croceorrhizus]KAI6098448.1 hypothetical protein EV401DRAFT_2082024 [Pisolithus croceorrhizus]KAI6098897.1 hypothetical protein EV401DRAFT_2081844 [Pisolithus croceorrhizus]